MFNRDIINKSLNKHMASSNYYFAKNCETFVLLNNKITGEIKVIILPTEY